VRKNIWPSGDCEQITINRRGRRGRRDEMPKISLRALRALRSNVAFFHTLSALQPPRWLSLRQDMWVSSLRR